MNLARINARMSEIENWAVEGDSIVKDFEFPGFKEAIDFLNKIAEVAEKHQHHPYISINYNNVHLQLTTKEEKGLSDKDFDLAKDIDLISK